MAGWNTYFDAPLLQGLLSAQGVPAIDQPTVALNTTYLVPTGVSQDGPVLDMRRFQGYSIFFSETSGYTGTGTRLFSVKWFSDAAATQFITEDYYSVGAYSGVAEITGKPKGPYLWPQWSSFASGTNATLTLRITGYYRQLSESVLFNNGNLGTTGLLTQQGWNGVAIMSWSAATVFSPAKLEYPVTFAGPADLLFWPGSAPTADVEVAVLDAFTITRIAVLRGASGSLFPITTNLIIPTTQIVLRIAGPAAGFAGSVSLQMTRQTT